VAVHRLQPLLAQLRRRDPGRRGAVHPHPRRPSPPRVAGLRLSEGVAPRLLPEQREPAALPDAPYRRGWLRAHRLGDRDLRGRGQALGNPRRARRPRHRLLRRWRPGKPPRRRLRGALPGGARHPLHLQLAGAGEDRRLLGQRPALRPPDLPRHRGHRGERLRHHPGRQPVAGARHPAGSQGHPRAGEGSRANAGRGRPAAHAHRRAGGHSSPGSTRNRRLPDGRHAGDDRAGRAGRSGVPRSTHHGLR
jgi:hypothetical protein